jgi:O-antigen/teichoic acid export membrane protein
MATATQRFLSFELGRGDSEKLQKVFSVSLIIYVLIALFVLILAETAGLWFVSNKLTIPPERKIAALRVYHFAVISFMFTVLTTPYMAMIIAHEAMNIYAYVSIVEAVLKLAIVFVLRFISWDKLQLYGILSCAVVFINTAVYRTICMLRYRECGFRIYWDKAVFREIAGYTGWNIFTPIANLLRNNGINILLNQFFSPSISAARSVAHSVDAVVAHFCQNFNTALRPQIVKSYASDAKKEAVTLVFRGVKGTYFLIYIFMLPLILEMPVVLTLWLKYPPEYTVLFTRLILINVVIDSVNYPLRALVMATGRIKYFQCISACIALLNLPLSWIALLFGMPAYSVMIISIGLSIIATITQWFMAKKIVVFFPLKIFVKEVLFPLCIASLASMVLPLFIYNVMLPGFLRLCLITGISIVSTISCMYAIGLDGQERVLLKKYIKTKILKSKKVQI